MSYQVLLSRTRTMFRPISARSPAGCFSVGILICTFWPVKSCALDESPSDLLARMSAVYADMQPSYMMHAEIWRRTSFGEQWREGRRRYRIVQKGAAMRLDLLGAESPIITRMRRPNGNVLMYTSAFRKYSEQPGTHSSAGPVLEVLERFRITLHARFADLAATEPVIRAAKPAQIKVGASKKDCLRIAFKTPSGLRRGWSGTVWIDRDSAVVWRATMFAQNEHSEIIEEDITWQKIVTGEAVSAEEFDWNPPPGTERIVQFPYRLPQ